ncbi:MAG: hypothetical protein HOO89_00565 [Ferruginibacter sp.]|nr:hypothetical protein [Ferruginibacter sp.]
MFKTLLFFSLSILFFSCSSLKIPKSKLAFSELGIGWNYEQKVNPVYDTKIDSAFKMVINRFNRENHSFKVHERKINESNYLHCKFTNGKFVSKSGITTGYVVTGIGLFATPIIILSATNGGYFGFFYYLPHDNLDIEIYLSPASSDNKTKTIETKVSSLALFSNKNKRLNQQCKKLENTIYKMLINLDKQFIHSK